MIKGRKSKGPPATDLLVCFSRPHLSLLPKPICSPARGPESTTLPQHRRHPSHHHHLKKPSNRGGSTATHGRIKHNSDDISEPTSPKVTCAGQIKVRAKPSSCKNWQSVMEEIERLHNNRKNKKSSAWVESIGFKKEVMQFLTCLRNIRFDFRCFGAIPRTVVTSDGEEDDDEDDNGDYQGMRAVFSKWFMILQEDNTSKEIIKFEESSRKVIRTYCDEEPPPPNALLLMRCRSAPAKRWLEEREEEGERDSGSGKEEKAMVDFSEVCGEIKNEIQVTEETEVRISRCRSWKR